MINQVILVGRLTRDPDFRYTSEGTAVATFHLAVNRNFKNQAGEIEADFVSCRVWRKLAENVANYCKKGSLIGITGKIQTRRYEDKRGSWVYVTDVVGDNVRFLDKRKENIRRNVNEEDKSEKGTKFLEVIQ